MLCCQEFPILEKRQKTHQKKGVKKIKIPDLTRGGNSNDIAHHSQIQVNMVLLMSHLNVSFHTMKCVNS